MSPRRILILLAHPALERSRVNRVLAEGVSDLPGVTVHDLYDAYPTLSIDPKHEQRLLTDHDVVVFQHPFFWYSTPAILKEWQDLVLEHGWAYGSQGRALTGKLTFNAVSTGGPAPAYQPGGFNRLTVRQYLAPYEQTARLCGMRFLAPLVVHATHRLETAADVAPHVARYRAVLGALRDDTLDLSRAESATTLQDALTEAASTP